MVKIQSMRKEAVFAYLNINKVRLWECKKVPHKGLLSGVLCLAISRSILASAIYCLSSCSQ